MLLFNYVLLTTVFKSCFVWFFFFQFPSIVQALVMTPAETSVLWISLTVLKSEDKEAQVKVPLI